jgi:hypothetical protein
VSLSSTSKHFASIYLGQEEDTSREVLGVFLKDGRKVEIYVSADGQSVRVLLDGAQLKGKK